MVYIIAMLLGCAILIIGLYITAQALAEINRSYRAFLAVQESADFKTLMAMKDEMDELNYSYYEILDDISLRLDAVERVLQLKRPDVQDVVELEASQTRSTTNDLGEALVFEGHQSTMTTKRQLVATLLSEGLTTNEIAKTMGIGIGEVEVLKRTLKS